MPTMGYEADPPELSPWAQRAKKAHLNMVENLVLFAPAVLAYQLVTAGKPETAVGTAAMVFVISRVLHYVVYVAKVPVVRTLSFFGGYGATLFIAVKLLQAL